MGRRPNESANGRRGALHVSILHLSVPVTAIQTSVLDCFSQMFCGHPLCFAQVRDGAGDLEDAVVRPRREPHPPHGHL